MPFPRSIASLLGLLVHAHLAIAQTGWTVHRYTANDGLPQNSVRSLAFDGSGFLWFTTEGGLVRYDGRNFKVYNGANTPVLVDDRMGHLMRDHQGTLLVNDMSRQLYRINGPEVARVRGQDGEGQMVHLLTGGLPSVEAYAGIAGNEDPDRLFLRWDHGGTQIIPLSSERWAALGPDGLSIFTGNERERVVPLRSMTWSTFTWEGRVHVRALDGEVYRVDDRTGRLQPLIQVNGPGGSAVRFLWSSAGNGVFAVSADSLWQVKTVDAERIEFELLVAPLPTTGWITSASFSPDGGVLFLGTSGRGLFRLTRTHFHVVRLVESHPGSTSNSFYALVPVDNASVLTTDAFIVRRTGSSPAWPEMKRAEMHVQHRDHLGRYWSAARNHLRIHDPARRGYVLDEESPVGLPSVMLQEGDTTWVMGRTGLSAYVSDRPVLVLPIDGADYRRTPVDLLRAPDGNLWYANGQGVFKVEPHSGKVEPVPGLQSLPARALHREGDLVFVGTYGRGAYVVNGDRIHALPLDPQGDLRQVHGFIPDAKDHFWLPTNKGLYRVSKAAVLRFLSDSLALVHYAFHGYEEGLSTLEFNGGCSPGHVRLANGDVVLPSIDGLVWFRPEEVPDPWPQGKILVEHMVVDGVDQTPATSVISVGQEARLELDLSLPFWGNPRNAQLKYRMVGSGMAWEILPANGHLVLERMPAGTYTLQVLLPNDQQDHIQELLTYKVLPAWYFRWWALVIGAGLLVMAVRFLIRYRMRIYQRHLDHLEHLVRERTDALHESNNALKREGEVKDRLMHIVSHDLVAPLKAIARVGRMGSAPDVQWSEKELRAAFLDMATASQQLHDNASNLLSWIKHQGGRIQLRARHVALHALVQQVVSPLRETCRQQAVDFHNLVEEELLVHVDPDILAIILQNLVSNALKYAPGSTVSVSASVHEGRLEIGVKDTGPGMSLASQQRIRSLLRAGDRDIDLRSGLGYVIIADLAALMEGSVDLHTDGTGTEVILALRVTEPVPA
jgi:signal transduction histidine kinase/ligand-binding sensor domain-containing protein